MPVSTANPQTLRNPFPNNVIPPASLNPAAALMLKNYVPRPNTMGDMGYGMTMNGTPAVFGAGQDSNNLLDVRDALERNNQGTIRVDRNFGDKDTLNVRYSTSHEDGFTPQNLPAYGYDFDNASQNGAIIWTRILSPSMVNTASVGASRLAMSHWAQDNGVNDIVDALGITGTNFGGQKGWGAPYFNVQGYTPFGDSWQATPMEQWNTTVEGREALSRQAPSMSCPPWGPPGGRALSPAAGGCPRSSRFKADSRSRFRCSAIPPTREPSWAKTPFARTIRVRRYSAPVREPRRNGSIPPRSALPPRTPSATWGGIPSTDRERKPWISRWSVRSRWRNARAWSFAAKRSMR